MSHKNKKCLRVQAMERFQSLLCLGRSKHQDKVQAGRDYDKLPTSSRQQISKFDFINNALRDKIYSYKTYETYEQHNNYFLKYCEEKHKCKTLAECRQYADEWIRTRIDERKSAYTVATEKAGLSKLFGEPATNFVSTPKRKREAITKSRGEATRDKGFSVKNNKEFVDFCRGTGLRRSEIKNLKGTQLCIDSGGGAYISVVGKGGRFRQAPIIGQHKDKIIKRMQSAGSNSVWEKVPSHADIHSYRADYATSVYNLYARENIPKEDKYICRNDMQGVVLDKQAMLQASQALGHNRIDIVASHYIRTE